MRSSVENENRKALSVGAKRELGKDLFLQLIHGFHRRLERVKKLSRLREALLMNRSYKSTSVVAGVVTDVRSERCKSQMQIGV